MEEFSSHSGTQITSFQYDWNGAFVDEVQFWNRVIENNGGPWPEEHRMRLDPHSPLHPGIIRWIAPPYEDTVEILDVGAGPLSILGKVWLGHNIRVTAVDPLAEEYNQILKKHNIIPPVRTIAGDALLLTSQFARNVFDLVFCRNAMDHCSDPLKGIQQCLEVVKPGKYVLLNHFRNEAVNQNYHQLHQWNFDKEGGRFIIWNRQARFEVSSMLSDLVEEIFCDVKPNGWHVAALKKRW